MGILVYHHLDCAYVTLATFYCGDMHDTYRKQEKFHAGQVSHIACSYICILAEKFYGATFTLVLFTVLTLVYNQHKVSQLPHDLRTTFHGTFVTVSAKTVLNGTFIITRITNLKYSSCCGSIVLDFSHARFTV